MSALEIFNDSALFNCSLNNNNNKNNNNNSAAMPKDLSSPFYTSML